MSNKPTVITYPPEMLPIADEPADVIVVCPRCGGMKFINEDEDGADDCPVCQS